MHDGPFTVLANPDGDRLHFSLTSAFAITRGLVEVFGPQAIWTVVAMIGPVCVLRNDATAMATDETAGHLYFAMRLIGACHENKSFTALSADAERIDLMPTHIKPTTEGEAFIVTRTASLLVYRADAN